ncbi:hypothetical protein FPV67DRAFT_1497742 [Lyophyllum atratum]|nr:hypothetical protein FPV67DRAFT_1497742 [Lyophyllum atratum]
MGRSRPSNWYAMERRDALIASKALTATMESLSESVKTMMVARYSHITKRVRDGSSVKAKVDHHSRPSKEICHLPSAFGSVPTDIFLEIGSALEPADLLSLSRVSKQFRAIFMSRNSRFVWAAAFRRAEITLGLPVGCPPDMNEPQYASLIFDQLCSACNSVDASEVYFSLRLRFCLVCEKVNIRPGTSISHPPWMERGQIWKLLPAASYPSRPMATSSQRNIKQHRYSVVEHAAVAHQYLDLRHDQGALGEYRANREVVATVLMQHGFLLTRWDDNRLTNIAEQRKARPRIVVEHQLLSIRRVVDIFVLTLFFYLISLVIA